MKQLTIVWGLFAALCCLPAGVRAESCSGLPTSFTGNEFPKGNFLTNFNNNCYLIPFSYGDGSVSEQGDTNSVYYKLFFNINSPNTTAPKLPPYELVIIGEFQNSRYFSIGLYDDHSAITQNLTDVNMLPLTSSYINPYLPGVTFVDGQHYGAAIHLGGTAGTQQTGCMMTGNNIESNVMDGTQRHPYMNWNLDKAFLGQGIYPYHQVDTPEHSNPNTAGVIIIRNYLDLTASTTATEPHVIVRDVASGCAYPSAYISSLANVVTTDQNTGNTWQNQQQVQEHNLYANWQATQCWGVIYPYSDIQWYREDEFTAGANPDAGYLLANVAAGLAQSLFNAGKVFLIQFKVPVVPPTPCSSGCSRSGNEQMRYMSISFEIPGGGTLVSLPDSCPAGASWPCTPLVKDVNGNVNLVVSTGVAQPSWATPANGYTWVDLSKLGNPNYMQLNEIAIRHILPNATFNCGTQMVPYKVGEATGGNNGLMGLYSPWITEPLATSLPNPAAPATCPVQAPTCTSCGAFPSGLPATITPTNQNCHITLANKTQITALSTQCATTVGAGCTQVIVQPTPPIAVTGMGFGSFPLGLPYSGNSNFIEITDTTQNWNAGHTGSNCTVTIGEWSDSLVSLIANVNQANGACPMAAGDNLAVTVWNPQTFTSASLAVTVGAQTSNTQKQ